MNPILDRAAPRRWLATGLALLGAVAACSPEPTLEELRGFQESGRFADTIEPLRARLEVAPDDPELNHLYGLALLRTGQAALAIWPLRKSAADPSREITDSLLLIEAILAGGSAEDAIPVVNRVLELEPDRVEALRLRVAALSRSRMNEEVLVDVDRLLELKPGDPDALTSRLLALLSLDRAEEAEQALAALSDALKNHDGGYEWEPRVCGATATFFKEKGEPEAAEQRWNECLEHFPADELIVFPGVEFFIDANKGARATEILRRAFEAAPTNLAFVEAYANRLAVTGDSEQAERILLAATEDDVNAIQAWFTAADYYERRDEFGKAAEVMANGLALMGEIPPMVVGEYVDLLIRAGELEQAEAFLPKFENEPLISNLLRGRLLLVRGKSAEALEALEEGLRIWPDNAVARTLVAEACEQQGDFDRAVIEYAEALRASPSDRDALKRLLRLLEAIGRDDEAGAVLDRFWRENPNDTESLLQVIRFAGRANQKARLDRAVRLLGEIPTSRGALIAELAAIQFAREGPVAGIASIRGANLDLRRPVNGPALRKLVEYLIADGKAREALREVDAALAANADVPLFHELRGAALSAAGDKDGARASFERAIGLDPKRAAGLAGLAALAAERGESASAIELYDRASAADLDDSSYAWQALQLVAAS
ncbi:MAG TPA: tetratricopeptide repeat protein, partial [Myxococcota bacterium]|nr:tetratricopeptide repeat protein [Myxococcota bacterium]